MSGKAFLLAIALITMVASPVYSQQAPPPSEMAKHVEALVNIAADYIDAQLYRRGVLDRDAKNPREDLRRVKNSLQARRLIGERDGVVWRTVS